MKAGGFLMGYNQNISTYRYEEIKNEYNKLLKERRGKVSKVWTILIVIYLVIMAIILLIFPDLMNNESGRIFYIIYGSIVGFVVLLGLIISLAVKSEKPFFNYVLKEIIQRINREEETYIEYISYPKKQEQVNKSGGLFTRGCYMDVKSLIKGKTDAGNSYSIYNTRLYSSDGKNQYQHFNGIYIAIDYSNNKLFQIRSHSKPKLKGTKFKRINEENELKIFVEDTETTGYIDEKYIRLVSNLKDKLNAKKIYLSGVNNKIHFAYENADKIKKPKVLSLEVLNDLHSEVRKEISIVNQIVEDLNQSY